MISPNGWTIRTSVVGALTAFSTLFASAQTGQPPLKNGTTHPTETKVRPNLPPYHPPTTKPSINVHSGMVQHPTTTTAAGHTSPVSTQPAINNSAPSQLALQNSLLNPYLNNPYVFNPYPSLSNPFNSLLNPFTLSNPYLPLANAFNPFLNYNPLTANGYYTGFNPWAFSPYANPHVAAFIHLNIFANPMANPLTNPFLAPQLFSNPFVGVFGNPFGIFGNGFGGGLGNGLAIAPPIAVQQPGPLVNLGPNLVINPLAGTVIHPVSGFATMADGSTFYHIPGSGIGGAGIYYNPLGGTIFNPQSGIVARPAQVIR